jgi:hypothetical protein
MTTTTTTNRVMIKHAASTVGIIIIRFESIDSEGAPMKTCEVVTPETLSFEGSVIPVVVLPLVVDVASSVVELVKICEVVVDVVVVVVVVVVATAVVVDVVVVVVAVAVVVESVVEVPPEFDQPKNNRLLTHPCTL